MKIGVNLKIDVTKIDKSKLFVGQKGKYLDAQVFIELEPDQYGNNGMITQAVSEDERKSGTRGAILGNCKVFWKDAQPSNAGNKSHPAPELMDFDDSDIAF